MSIDVVLNIESYASVPMLFLSLPASPMSHSRVRGSALWKRSCQNKTKLLDFSSTLDNMNSFIRH